MNAHITLRTGLALLLFTSLSSVSTHAKDKAPMLEARDNLERVNVLLQQPHVARPQKHENAVANQLTRALTNLEEAKKDKGSQLPEAIKDVKAAQAELEAGDDAAHQTKALEYVQSALKHVEKGWANRGNH